MPEAVVDSWLNQYGVDMLTEEISLSKICCMCLKETGGALACKTYPQKIHTSLGHIRKDDEMYILCTLCCKTEYDLRVK